MVLDNGSLNAQQVRIQALGIVIGWYKGWDYGCRGGIMGVIGWKMVICAWGM